MRIRGPLPSLLLVLCTGCVHTAPATTVASAEPPTSGPPREEPAAPAPVAALQDVTWQLRSGESASWSDAPLALHTFTMGRWECALGEVLTDDALSAEAVELRRTRRLACTHSTGATVQTQLGCTLVRSRERAGASTHGERARANDTSAAADAARELLLQLDASPAVHVRCAPVEVRELALSSRDRRLIATLCLGPSGIGECTMAASTHTTQTAVAPTPP
jgi:hypothetical protein